MIAHLTGGKALPREIADQIIDRTDGVPLFIEELTKSVVESGWMTDAGDHYSVTGTVDPLAIPMTLQASLLSRLDRLAPTREVAQIAATLGRQFSYELIRAVADLSQPQLNDALEQLISAELVFRRETPPDAMYAFCGRWQKSDCNPVVLTFRTSPSIASRTSTLKIIGPYVCCPRALPMPIPRLEPHSASKAFCVATMIL
jgi:hypothetical protein